MTSKTAKDNKRLEEMADREYQLSYLAAVERNQIPLSRALLIILYGFHLIKLPIIQQYTTKFLFLQNQVGFNANNKPVYDIHMDDLYYVINWVIMITFLRSFLMKWCFGPFASKFCHIHSRKAKVRFAEQSWSAVYYSFSFIYGVYLFLRSPYYNNLDHVYLGWPDHPMEAAFKRYYLISTAFWFQQIFVLNVEQHRKDHYQMFSHHIITCLLIVGSYYYYFYRIGHLILMIMDSVDIFLAVAKMLKYARYTRACDAMFILFLISWTVLRHGVYNYVFYHSFTKAMILSGPGECAVGAVQKRCWTPGVYYTFFSLLGGLQVITLIWMYYIVKVAYKVVTGSGAEDVRSDDEDTDVEITETKSKNYKQREDYIQDLAVDTEDLESDESVDSVIEVNSKSMERDIYSSASDVTLGDDKDLNQRNI
ncbi:lag1 [[Candida] subhashii]|uniref:Lag1 n=1 Tax=[Candida] subhashii TaxID=561895 RepID=A0A8J5URK2_9ASCO|nr:lag1 [[Candida] subhashii]KAG7664712.1 lag1 [[Candida] subhashii]